MEYVFGSTFLCKNTDVAREVAFNREIHTRSVTLEGDIFQPSGLLTGGSCRGGGQLLRQLHDLAGMEAELSAHQKKLSDIEAKLSEILPLQKEVADLNAKLELKMHELLLFHTRAEQTVQHKLAELVKKTEQELEELKAAAKGKELEHKDCVNAVSLLEKYDKEHGNNRDGMLQNLKEKIKATKSKLQSCLKDLEGHENEREKLVMKMEAVVQEKALLEAELDALETRINRLTLEIEEQGAKVFSVKSSNERAQFELHDSFEGEGM